MLVDRTLFGPWNGWKAMSTNLHFVLTCSVAVSLLLTIQLCSLCTLLLFVNWVAGGHYEGIRRLKQEKVGILLLAFYALHVLGMAYSDNMHYGLSDLERKLSLFVLPLVLFSTPLSLLQRNVVLLVFISTCLLLSGIGLVRGMVHYTEIIQQAGPEHLITYFADMHRVYFSMYLLFGYLVLFWFLTEDERQELQVRKWLLLCGMLLLVGFIFVMASRMILILLVLSSGILLVYHTVIKKRQYAKALLLAGAGLAVMVVVYTQVRHVREFMGQLTQKLDQGQTSEVNSVNIRVVKYKCALEGISQHWLFGVGTGDIQDVLNDLYRKNNFTEGYQVNMDAHNQYLQTWLSLGLPGLLLFVAFVVLSLRKAIVDKNYLLFVMMAIFACCCISESLLTTQKGIVFLALMYPLVHRQPLLRHT